MQIALPSHRRAIRAERYRELRGVFKRAPATDPCGELAQRQ
jgi:hypothetical protein